ncbi:MAG: DUF4278 domain-containing protein [Elainellaceae cyanobacterium]
MQLFYRGIGFEASPQTLETSPSSLTGKYRSCLFKVRQLDPRVPAAAIALRYRGVTYLSARHRIVMSHNPTASQANQLDLPQ